MVIEPNQKMMLTDLRADLGVADHAFVAHLFCLRLPVSEFATDLFSRFQDGAGKQGYLVLSDAPC